MILAHMDMNRGQSKMNRTGQTVEKVSGHGRAKASRHTARRTRPLQADTAGGLSARHRPQRNKQLAVGRPRSKTMAADDVGRSLAVQCRLVEGVRWCWPLRRRARTYLVSLSTYRLCPAMPTDLLNSLPRSVHFALPPVHSLCARIESTVCKLQ